MSNDPMPAELKRCIKSWKRKLPDYKIKKWDTHNFDIYSIPFVAEACKMRKWAFACDYIRVYALYTEGGIYMDSDVFVRNSLDFCLANRAFSAVECYPESVEKIYAEGQVDAEGNKRKDIQYIDGIQIQAAILGAEKGHPFMRDCMNYYHDKHFILPDGSLNNKIISPFIFDKEENCRIFVILFISTRQGTCLVFVAGIFMPVLMLHMAVSYPRVEC